jgi:nitroimidazol reductase NimA-like FMN-containing flavoprotein (pyridoxamine 5'-phosphate oxidase superfamily)
MMGPMVDRRRGTSEPDRPDAEPGSSDRGRELDEIGEEECYALLQTQDLGRLAIVRDGRPEIFPVNYALSDHIIVIRTQPGVKLSNASFAHVAFEVEDIDLDTREGWVVEVRGLAEEITDAINPWAEEARRAEARPWVMGPHEHYLSITRSQVSGRRLRRPAAGD